MSSRAGGRDLLMILQVALACILTLSTCLLLQTFLRLRSPDKALDPETLLVTPLYSFKAGETEWQRTAFVNQSLAGVARLPGILAVGASNVSPFSGAGTANRFRLEGDSLSTEYRSAAWRAVTPGFLHAMHLALEQGRFFTHADQAKSLQVVAVTRSFARQYWPGQQDLLGKRILWGSSGRAKTVVGVVADLRDLSPAEQPRPTIFLPFEQLPDAPMTALIRFNGNSPPRASDIRQAIWNVDPQAPVELQPLSSKIADRLFPERGTLQLMSAFALLSMLIAAFGLYGLVSYRVSQKRLETGIRLALGASVGGVRWSVHRRALTLVTAGLALGLPAAFGLSRIISSLLEGSANAPYLLYLLVATFFLCVAMLASYFPARHAAGMEPALLIRHDP